MQQLLPRGMPAEVRAEVVRLRAECGAGGGYILAPARRIQADTPHTKIGAFDGEARGMAQRRDALASSG